MNMLKVENSIYHGFIWCPENKESLLLSTISNISKSNEMCAQIEKIKKPEGTSPPTYFNLNKFTKTFQVRFLFNLIDNIFF